MDGKGSAFDLYEDSAAIRELGPLFKLTLVDLWDDGRRRSWKSCKVPENGVVGSEKVGSPSGGGELLEEDELTKEMAALGLPVSFNTSKELQNKRGTSKGRKKGRQSNVGSRLGDGVCDFCEGSMEDAVSGLCRGNSSDCVSSKTAEDVSFVDHVTDDLIGLHHFSAQKELLSSWSEIDHVVTKELVSREMSDLATSCIDVESTITEDASNEGLIIEDDRMGADETEMSSQFPSVVSGDTSVGSKHASFADNVEFNEEINNLSEEHLSTGKLSSPSGSEMFRHNEIGEYQCKGDWFMFWDAYYGRYYFCNVKTQVSTWLEPPGFEHSLNHESTVTDGELEPANNADLAPCSSCSEISDPLQGYVYSSKDIHEKFGSVDLSTDEVLQSTELILDSRSSSSELANAIQDCTDSSGDILEEHRVADQPSEEVCQNARITLAGPELSNRLDTEERNMPPSVGNICNKEREMPEWFNTRDNGTDMEASILAEGHSLVEYGTCAIDNPSGKSTAKKRKKKVKKSQSQKNVLQDHEELRFPLNEEYSTVIEKYWFQRYSLFSRFDSGVKMDEEGWFSVTPETIAKHHALRCTGVVVVDGFTGVGGNAIHFAQCGWHVIAVDIDPKKIEYAHHNAIIYEVGDQIDFIKGDFFHLGPKLKADTVFLSPPWGGPGYSKVETYDLKTMLKPHDGFFLFHTARKVASEIVMFLPKNVDPNQLAEIALSVQPPWGVEVIICSPRHMLSKISLQHYSNSGSSNRIILPRERGWKLHHPMNVSLRSSKDVNISGRGLPWPFGQYSGYALFGDHSKDFTDLTAFGQHSFVQNLIDTELVDVIKHLLPLVDHLHRRFPIALESL